MGLYLGHFRGEVDRGSAKELFPVPAGVRAVMD